MNDAVWLLLALPEWYLSSATAGLTSPPYSVTRGIGVILLIIGAGIGLKIRCRRLWLFIVPFLLTEGLVAFAGIYRGQIKETVGKPILLMFLGVLTLISIWNIWRLKGTRLPASLLAIFSITYSQFGAFVAAMSFSDNWL